MFFPLSISVYVLTMDDDDETGFKSPVGKSVVCASQLTILDDYGEVANYVGVLRVDLYDSHLEAFRANRTDDDFSDIG